MVLLVKLMGIFIVVMGANFMAKPDTMKKWMDFWMQEKRVYAGAAVSLVIGVLFLMGASQCRIGWIVTVMGVMSLVKGIMLIVGGKEKMAKWANVIMGKPAKIRRRFAILALAIGVLLIYAA